MNNLIKKLFTLILLGYFSTVHADNEIIQLFSLANYNQQITHWIKPTGPNYDKPLVTWSQQQEHYKRFYNHYVGIRSPWDATYVNEIFHQIPSIQAIEESAIHQFGPQDFPDKRGYGENFRPYSKNWINTIKSNINLAQFNQLTFQSNHRAIAIENLYARELPTDDVHFYNHKLAGQGYPFDNLQSSSLWAGTPVYIVGETVDHAWSLVIAPDYVAWVKSSGLALVSNAFVAEWTLAAKRNVAAITRTKTSIMSENGKFIFMGYVGMVFPAEKSSAGIKLRVPVSDSEHNAVIKYAVVASNSVAMMPLLMTPHHFSNIIHSLLGRPYGWGNQYFYNDCSSELKNLFTPFGIWLPRHSSDQATAGRMVDKTALTAEERLSYLVKNGRPFLTLIYIGHHVVLYVGNFTDKQTGSLMAMTYQNVWALKPLNVTAGRSVIGKSAFLPMLLQYPEDTNLTSQANSQYFQVTYLDEILGNEER